MSVNPDHIFLTDGASVGVRMSLNALIRGPNDSIMVPVPQYPLYSASVALYNGNFVGYELDEGNGWGMDVNDLQVSLPLPPALPLRHTSQSLPLLVRVCHGLAVTSWHA